MKHIKTLLLLLVIALAACTAPAEETPRAEIVDTVPEPVVEEPVVEEPEVMVETVDIDTEESTFQFIGYGPGKSHEGEFMDMKGTLTLEGDNVIGAEGTIETYSLTTGISGLDQHLKKDDFLDVATYPQITMRSQKIEDGMLTGTLTFHGVTKTLSFPVETSNRTLSAETVINIKDFGIDNEFANEEVSIILNLHE